MQAKFTLKEIDRISENSRRAPELEVEVVHHKDGASFHIRHLPESIASRQRARLLVNAVTLLRGGETDYNSRRQQAEYGGGLCRAKRPSEFGALRLVK